LRAGSHGSTDDFGVTNKHVDPTPAPSGATIYSVDGIIPSTSAINGWEFDTAKHYQLQLETRIYFRPRSGESYEGIKLARVAARHRFSNPLGISFNHFSKGGKQLTDWLDDNSQAIPIWYNKLGPFDCVVQTHGLNTGGSTPSHDDLYDKLNDFIDLWRSINSSILIWMHPPHYTRRGVSSMSDEDAREFKEKVASVFHLVSRERDCLFTNTPKWMHKRFGYYHETQTRSVPDSFDPENSYDRGDVVSVENDESTDAPESPEARGRNGHYICTNPIGPNIDPDEWPGNQRYWTRIDYGGWDNIHLSERVEEERYRLLAGIPAGIMGGPDFQQSIGVKKPIPSIIGSP